MRCSLLLLLLALAAPVFGQTAYTWTGPEGGRWDQDGNWSPEGVPADQDTAIVASGVVRIEEAQSVAGLRLTGGTITGTATLSVTDLAVWEDGALGRATGAPEGMALRVTGALRIDCTGTCSLQGSSLRTEGATAWISGVVDSNGNASAWTNTGTLNLLEGAEGLRRRNAWIDFTNDGTVRKRGVGTETILYSPFGDFDNNGIVVVEAGTLTMRMDRTNADAANDGTWRVESGAELLISEGDYVYAGPVEGGGTLRVAGESSVSANPTVTFGESNFDGDVILDSGALTLPGRLARVDLRDGARPTSFSGVATIERLTWTGGRLGGPMPFADVVVTVELATLTGPADKVLDGVTLVNAGAMTWDEGDLVVNDSNAFTNALGATFTIAGAGVWRRTNGSVTFLNEGLLVKTSGGVTLVDLPFAPFDNAGRVEVEDGTLQLNTSDRNHVDTGIYSVAEGAALRFGAGERRLDTSGRIEGLGTLSTLGVARFVAGGTLAPGLPSENGGVGTLDVSGDLTDLDGTLEIDLGGSTPGSEHDIVNSRGAVTLGGTLRVVFADGFTPEVGDQFVVVQADAVAGTFDAIDGPEGYAFQVAQDEQTVTLVVAAGALCPAGFQADDATVALYKLDEAVPGIAYDATDNDRDGFDVGTTVIEGDFCLARRFDGADDRIELFPVIDALDLQDEWTIEYVAASDGAGVIPPLYNGYARHGWLLRHEAEVIEYGIKTDAAAGSDWTARTATPAPAPDGAWHYYALAWDGALLRVYYDGMVLDSVAATGITNAGVQMSFPPFVGGDIADDGTERFFSGLADDLRFSDRARTSRELFDEAVRLGFASPVADEDDGGTLPAALALDAPYPNPAAARATLRYGLPEAGVVTLTLYDLLGRRVGVLADGAQAAGWHEATLDAADLPSGVYVARLDAGGAVQTRRLTVVR